MHRYLYIFLLLSCFQANAQISDSLYKALTDTLRPKNKMAVTDQDRMKMINNSSPAFIYRFHDEFKAMDLQLEKAIERVKANEDKMLYASAIGAFYVLTGELSLNKYWYKKVIQYGEDGKANRPILGNAYLNVAMVDAFEQKQDSAVSLLHKAASIATADKDSATLRDTYFAYIAIYGKLKLYKRAIDYANNYLKAFPARDKWSVPYTQAVITKSHLYAYLYRDAKKPAYADSAKVLIQDVMKATKKDEAYWYQICYTLLGLLHYNGRDYSTAVRYYDLGLLPKYNQPGAYEAELLYKRKVFRNLSLIQIGEAANIQEVLAQSIPSRDLDTKQELNKVLAEYYTQRGDYQKALDHYKKYKVYADSSDLIGQKGRVFEAEQKYSVVQKEAAIAVLENKNLQAQTSRNKLLITGIVIMLALAILAIIALLLYLRNKRQLTQRLVERQKLTDELHSMEQELELDRLRQETEKEEAMIGQRKAISKNMHDEVSSDLAAVRYFIADLGEKVKTDEARQVLAQVEDEVQTVYQQSRNFMHRLAENNAQENYSIVDLLDNLSLRFGDKSGLQIHTSMEATLEQTLTAKQNAELYKVVKEAVANSLKHSGASQMDIHLYEDKESIVVDITDNGRGLVTDAGKGLGMITMRERIESLGGHIQISSSTHGMSIHGNVPKIA